MVPLAAVVVARLGRRGEGAVWTGGGGIVDLHHGLELCLDITEKFTARKIKENKRFIVWN